jgi:hypothetical protein
MKRFYVICSALVVGILLVGSVHAEPPRSGHRFGHHLRYQSRTFWTWRQQLLVPWVPQPFLPPVDPNPGSVIVDPAPDGSDPNSVIADPNAGGDDPNAGTYQEGGVIGRGNSKRQVVTPKGGGPRMQPRISNGTPRIMVSPPRRR